MLSLLLLLPASLRGWLARIVGLRWAHIGRFDLVVPAAIAIVVWTTAPQLGRDAGGIPFWVAWIVATAAIVVPLRLRPRLQRRAAAPGEAPAPGPATPGSAAPGEAATPRPAPRPAATAGSAAPGEAATPRPAPRPAATARPAPGPAATPATPTLGLTLVVGILVSWVIYDILFWGQTIQLYDLEVYLGSASRWLDGGQPYLTAPLTAWPATPQSDYFLYPPPLLPVFAALSRLPGGPVDVGWVAFLMACAYTSYRLLGLSRTWSVALLAFPPVAIGFESGNVASLTFLLFVAGFRTGGALIADGFFKVQTGLPALWLIRERRWRGILAGTVAVAVIVLATLPLVGLDSWRAWWEGLGYRAESQIAVPSLYGYSHARDLSGYLYTGISVALVGVALLLRGRSGLAALGLASIFASPALWPHGFVFALPALLMFENGALVWMLLGTGAIGPDMWHLFWGGWVALLAARRLPSGPVHPLAGTDGPWPSRRRRQTPAQAERPAGLWTPDGSGLRANAESNPSGVTLPMPR